MTALHQNQISKKSLAKISNKRMGHTSPRIVDLQRWSLQHGRIKINPCLVVENTNVSCEGAWLPNRHNAIPGEGGGGGGG